MSGLEFVIDSRVKTVSSPITLRIVGLRTKEEVMKLMREALVKQAGIVITQLDDKRESVTFNDALPIK
jgi:AICAR transformylase/IMP cyclohydrolase PurH